MILKRLKTSKTSVVINLGGVEREILLAGIGGTISSTKVRSAINASFGKTIDNLYVHINRSGTIALGYGEEPLVWPEDVVWPEDEIREENG